MLRKVRLTLTALSALFAAAMPAMSQGVPLEGTWKVTVTPAPAPPGFPVSFAALETYSQGGGMLTSNALPVTPRTGQGTWTKKGGAYVVTILFLGVDLGAAGQGSVRIDHNITMAGNDAYEGSGMAQFLDANGNVLFAIRFTSNGRRLAVP